MWKVPSLAVVAERAVPTTDTCTLPSGSPPSALVTLPVRAVAQTGTAISHTNKQTLPSEISRADSGKSDSQYPDHAGVPHGIRSQQGTLPRGVLARIQEDLGY